MPRLLNRQIVRQALIALAFDLGGLLAGRIALIFLPLLQSAPWVLALFPPLLSVRGSIGGILSGKLSTMLHSGEAEPRLIGNTRQFYSLIRAIFVLTFADAVVIGALAFLINLLFDAAVVHQISFFVVVPPLTCLISMTVVIPMVSLVGIITFKRGLDPDVILYPVMSTVDDVVVTVCYVAVVNLALTGIALSTMYIAVLLLGGLFIVILARYRGEAVFKRTLTEGAPIVLLSTLLGIFGGIGLASLREEIERRPSVLILYPALIDTLGDIGAILGSMETTKLALGYSRSFRETFKETVIDLLSVEIAGAVMHVVFGLVAFLVARTTGFSPALLLLVAIALISNLVSFLFISVFSLAIATQTFKHGLDPDNFTIPLVTSVSDVGATLALMAALRILAA